MNFSSAQIEAITRSVLQELRSRGVGIGIAETASLPSSAVTAVARTDAGSVAGIDAKVITEDTLAGANASGQTVSIPTGAVITPSGHDYIRRHSVTISNHVAATVSATSGVLIFCGDNSAAVSAAATAKWTSVSAGCEFDAATKVTSHLPSPVICCVDQPSLVACVLNRDSDVRAAVLTQATDLSLLNTVMSPQVVCLDSTGWSFAALLKLFRQRSETDSKSPAGWKELAK